MTMTIPTPHFTPEQWRCRVAEVLTRARDRSQLLTDAVDDDDLVRQHSTLMSPLVWDLAHVGNQEELWLVRDVGGRAPVRQDIDHLYDAFKHPRATRPSLPCWVRRKPASTCARFARRCSTCWSTVRFRADRSWNRRSRSAW